MTTIADKKLAADNIRLLSADAVQKANSGHPGMPMGCADFGFTLWYKYMRHNPLNPDWIGRDRFVLSAGHGSMLLYSLLYLFDYGLKLDDLKNFRQLNSLTPGHPEHGRTKGVEVTTGPLGSGFATAVGMAIEAKNFTARTGLDKTDLFKDQKIYALSGDGCLMEGCTHEAASLAGHLKLDNLICFYDSNSITIEGSTDLAFTENVQKRFEAYEWRVINIENANDIVQVEKGLDLAVLSDGRPTLIIGKTKIAYGAPNKAGTSSAHGEPLGLEELSATKHNLGFPDEMFFVNEKVHEICDQRIKELKNKASQWDAKFNNFLENNKEASKLISNLLHKPGPKNLLEELLKTVPVDKAVATRVSSGAALQKVAELIPAICGGAADLAPSTKTAMNASGSFSSETRDGRNLHFGIREFGMGLCMNGMSLYGTSIPYGSTFMVFSDYVKPSIKLAALQNLHVVYIFTHDSLFVGEDGPTHQPIEQLAMLRSLPNLTVIRPADARETAHAWNSTINADGPVALVLSRQNLEPIREDLADRIDLAKGAYLLQTVKNPDLILIATGSEVNLALKTSKLLEEKNIKANIVSMPSRELFLKQSKEYQESIIPSGFTNKVSIELASTFGWKEFTGSSGLTIGIDTFGASAPQKDLEKLYGFTPEQITDKIIKYFSL
ncbi:MAG: transketolase [bacterium]|nr:transketolase [bacterium]